MDNEKPNTRFNSMKSHRLSIARVEMWRYPNGLLCSIAGMGTSKKPILGRIAVLQILAIPKYCSGLRLALHPDYRVFRSSWIALRNRYAACSLI
ncbi:hypothetical protein EJG51_002995 [Undibacterium piscinae]|uniref:Uncharacterized protein n=1 Tax=Undibacterium piscinae TaxID=2495591 RepID=A0A6M4A1K4_9BURK|nr:hypothetical protein EJG51_002995 [Undibacterium piscinae]